MNAKLLIGGAVVVAVSLLIFGRFSGSNTSSGSTASLIHAGASVGSVRANAASDFTLQKLGGGTITLSEFRGKKPVVVDFWALR